MNKVLETLTTTVHAWSQDAVSSGWLNQGQSQILIGNSDKTPASLFDQPERPLVVAFFGGTGVGKSSLLNRLAGQPIARASAERPTSREITLYLHSSRSIDRLPAEFPVDRIRQASHDNQEHQSILWIDMPDFDSAETTHRELVDDWLPHIDALVYVVSPERYKDDQGWRLLLEHGARHAWVFLINHWDRGYAEQRDDFENLLKQAGLPNPLLFTTDCSNDSHKPNGDEFALFNQAVCEMADQLIVRQLQERGVLVRIAETRQQVDLAASRFGDDQAIPSLLEEWAEYWRLESEKITQSLSWNYRQLAKPYAELDRGIFSSLVDLVLRRKPEAQMTSGTAPEVDYDALLDGGFTESVGIGIDELALRAGNHALPATPVRKHTAGISTALPEHVKTTVKQQLQQSLAAPGTAAQRRLCKILKLLATVLPLGVMGWAAWKLISVYAVPDSAASYLGFNFASHTLLLALLGWLIPWLLLQKCRPTMEAAARRGMRDGITEALSRVDTDVAASMKQLSSERQQFLSRADQVFNELPGIDQNLLQNLMQEPQNPTLARVLVSPQQQQEGVTS